MANRTPEETRGAEISRCGGYRYTLWRRWGDGPMAVFVMLNPSTADANEDDATIRRCRGFAKREGCGGLTVINLYSLRSRDPDALGRYPYPNGPDEARHSAAVLREARGPVICGWGAHPAARSAAGFMLDLIRAAGHEPMRLGLTKEGAPRHPLYIKNNAPLAALRAGTDREGER